MMNYFDNPAFLRQIIMDHYEYPHNKRSGDETYQSIRMNTASCIDDITIYLKQEDEKITDLCFTGTACTVSTAATSIMTDLLMGKSIDQAQNIIDQYMAMIDLRDFDEELLGEAVALRNVGKQAHRIRCATLGWRGVSVLLESEAENGRRENNG